MTISKADKEFIENYKVYLDQAKLGFLHGISPSVLQGFDAIYRTYLDRNFVLTGWCRACVVDMMQRIDYWYQSQKDLEAVDPVDPSLHDHVHQYVYENKNKPVVRRGRKPKA